MIGNILDNTTELYMMKYAFGEIFSSRGETLCKNPSDQTVPYTLSLPSLIPISQPLSPFPTSWKGGLLDLNFGKTWHICSLENAHICTTAYHCSKFTKNNHFFSVHSPRLILTRFPQISDQNKSEAREQEGLVKITYGI